jgi:capsular exopolysaccharide synthesis family protein
MRSDRRGPAPATANGPSAGENAAGAYSAIPFAERHVLDYVRVLYKRRWTALPVVAVIVAFVAYSSVTTTPIYEASAQLLIEAEAQNIISFKEVVEQDRSTADYYQTQYRILQSRALAKATIDALQLWENPELGGRSPGERDEPEPTGIRRVLRTAKETPMRLLQRVMGEPSGTPSAGATPSDAAPATDETTTQSRIIMAFLGRLTIAPVRNSRLVDVKFRSADPTLAAAVANALAEQYIQRNLQFKFQASKEATDWLTTQLAEQRKQVEKTEAALQQYRESHDRISTEDAQDIVVQKLTSLNTAVTTAKTERINKEALYRQLQAVRNDPEATQSFPAVMSNPYIQRLKAEVADLERQRVQLSSELGDRHPDMVNLASTINSSKAKLQAEIENVVQSIDREYQTAAAQENSLVSALEAQKGEALALNRNEIGYRVLERDAAMNRQIFDTLLQRARETGISGELKTNSIRMADKADVPASPVLPRTRRDLMLALFVGSVLGIGLAFGAEYMENKIKSPDEIKAHLGLPCLGMVPKIPPKAMPKTAPLLNNGVPAAFAEAFRAVRTNVLFSAGSDRPRSIVVTSTAPGEGKTLVATNLATGLAMAGQRVLILDADMRRPRVHEVFGETQVPGLSDLLSGSVTTFDAARATTVPNLWIVPAGSGRSNPAELLSSPRFAMLLQALTRQFDWVIVDAPPIMPVTDASIIAHAAAAVLFVVGSEVATLPAALRALEQLDATNATFIGAVLNGVNLQRNSFFYAPYYKREYGEYYGDPS